MNWGSAKPAPELFDGDVRDFEPELEPMICAACGAEIDIETEPLPANCPICREPIDLQTQLAFSRGRDAFSVGQEYLIRISPKMRRRNMFTAEEQEGLQYLTQAYSSLQLAFQGNLAESQRCLGIEMMASMVNIFQQHQSVSEFEYAYWGSLLKELNTQLECVEVQQKIDDIPPGLFSGLIRLRWRIRLRQLENFLVEMNEKINKFESILKFSEPLKTRKKSS